MNKKVLFFDFEFTGLHKGTTPISLGIVSKDGNQSFYAEWTDYDESQVDQWLQENVIDNLLLGDKNDDVKWIPFADDNVQIKGSSSLIKIALTNWIEFVGATCDKIVMWSDVGYYDGVLFADIFGHSFNMPKKIDYCFRDLATLIEVQGFNLDTFSRSEFLKARGVEIEGTRHNALYDAKQIRAIYTRLFPFFTGYRKE